MSTTICLGGQQATSWTEKTEIQADALPASYQNHPFIFVFYSSSWEYVEEYGFLPRLAEMTYTPGVNGVEQDSKTKRYYTGKALGGHQSNGGVPIPTSDDRLGEWKNYIIEIPCKNGGKHYCFSGTEYEVHPNGIVHTIDTNSYNDFRKHLITTMFAGSPMSVSTFRLLLKMEQTRLNRLIKRGLNSDAYQRRISAQEARIAKMQKVWDSMSKPASKGSKVRGAAAVINETIEEVARG